MQEVEVSLVTHADFLTHWVHFAFGLTSWTSPGFIIFSIYKWFEKKSGRSFQLAGSFIAQHERYYEPCGTNRLQPSNMCYEKVISLRISWLESNDKNMYYFVGSGWFTNFANSNLDRLNFNLILMYFFCCCKEPDKAILYILRMNFAMNFAMNIATE